MKKILLIEDERPIAETLIYAFRTEGFACEHVMTLADGRRLLKAGGFAFVVLDLGLPDGSGLDFCREIRAAGDLPVLMLTARSAEIDRILGLELGADDYVTKPFSPREVMARVKTILKRTERGPAVSAAPAGFVCDDLKKRISYRGSILELGRYEYGLLKLLLSRPGQVYSREQLMEQVWQDPAMTLDRSVDAHVKSLRQKLKESGAADHCIVTHRGLGYSFREDV